MPRSFQAKKIGGVVLTRPKTRTKKTTARPLIVSRSELAQLIEVRAEQITRFISDGMPGALVSGSGRGHQTRIDLSVALPWLMSRRDPELMAARRALAQEKARAAKLANDEKIKTLIPQALSDRFLFESLRTIRESLLNLPARLSPQFVGADQDRIFGILDVELTRACQTSYERINKLEIDTD